MNCNANRYPMIEVNFDNLLDEITTSCRGLWGPSCP